MKLHWLPAAAIAGLAFWPAAAQTVTTTESYGEAYTYDYFSDGRLNTTYLTRVTARVGDVILPFDQAFYRDIPDPSVQAAFATIRQTRIWTANGRAEVLVWRSPIIIDSYEELLDSFTETSETMETRVTTSVQRTSGDAPNAVVLFGFRDFCGDAGRSGNTNTAPFDGAFATCSAAEEMTVEPGTVNVNTHTTTEYATVVREFTNTDILQYQQVELAADAVPIGAIHPSVQGPLLRSGADFAARLGGEQTLVQAAGYAAWVEFYGLDAPNAPDSNGPGSDNDTRGFAGGVRFDLGGGWSVGIGADRSDTDIALYGMPEVAELTLTQIGATIGYESGGFYVRASGAHGFGEAETLHGDATLGGVSAAVYDIGVTALSAETGYRFEIDGVSIVPLAGIGWTEARTDAFSETGGIGLAAGDFAVDQTEGWIGVAVAHRWTLSDDVWLSLGARGRAITAFGDQARTLPVRFVDGPADIVTASAAGDNGNTVEATIGAAIGVGPVALYVAGTGRHDDGDDVFGVRGGLTAAW